MLLNWTQEKKHRVTEDLRVMGAVVGPGPKAKRLVSMGVLSSAKKMGLMGGRGG